MNEKRGKPNNTAPRSRTVTRSTAPAGKVFANTVPTGKVFANTAPAGAATAGTAPAGVNPNRPQTAAGAQTRSGTRTRPVVAPSRENAPPNLNKAPPGRQVANGRMVQTTANTARGAAQPRNIKNAPQQAQRQRPPGTDQSGKRIPTAQPSGKRPPQTQTPGKRPPQQNKSGKSAQQAKRAGQSQNTAQDRRRAAKSDPGKLHAQTAAERRRHIAERQGFTPEQMEFLRRRSAIKRYYIKKNRISAITLFFTRFMSLVIIYVILFTVSSGLFWLGLNSYNHSKGEDVEYQIGENKDDADYKLQTLSYRDRVRGGQLYLNFTELAQYFGFITTGDTGELRYLTKYTDGEEVVFKVGTGTVTINGSVTRMPSSSYYEDGTLYVPLDFVQTYINGISASTDEDSGRLIIYREYTENAKGEKIYNDITFTLKPPVPSEHIDENSLPADIKLATEPTKTQTDTPETNAANGTDLTG